MASRRPVHRKRPERPTSRKGVLLCLFLAGAVLLVPIGGGIITVAKIKARDLALSTGLIDFDGCVVTPTQTIACTSGAIGTPLPAALHEIAEQRTQAAEERRLRLEAEDDRRKLVAEIERLNAEAERIRLATRNDRLLPPLVATVTRTGSSVMEAPITPAEGSSNDADPVIYEPSSEE